MSRLPVPALPRRRRRRRPLPALLAIPLALPAAAQTLPQSVALPTGLNTGGTSFMDGFTRTTPGWAVIGYLRQYDLDAVKDADGHDVAAFRRARIGTTTLLTQIAYVTGYRPFGGVLGFNAIVPLVDLDASFARDSPAVLRDSGFGVGDLTFGPYNPDAAGTARRPAGVRAAFRDRRDRADRPVRARPRSQCRRRAGVDFALDTTGSARVVRQAVESLAARGSCGILGASTQELSLDLTQLMSAGRSVRGIVEGESVPDVLIPRLIALYRQGRFPFDRLVSFYPFEQINQAFHDSEQGRAIKAIVRLPA